MSELEITGNRAKMVQIYDHLMTKDGVMPMLRKNGNPRRKDFRRSNFDYWIKINKSWLTQGMNDEDVVFLYQLNNMIEELW